ncbi:uncharacterized protein [Choristoneura fumiferana]|uniref:uncharacterized protein n=1 Tax=Choristoneura fumiferana TaxID=7141 RepID=UPI003D1558E1
MLQPLLYLAFITSSWSYRTSACFREYEEFSMCTWRCPPTCLNMKMLGAGGVRCPLPWECGVGCRCKAGFLRDEHSKKCVLVRNCPDATSCPKGEVMGYNLQCVRRGRFGHANRSFWETYVNPD